MEDADNSWKTVITGNETETQVRLFCGMYPSSLVLSMGADLPCIMQVSLVQGNGYHYD